MGIIGIPVAVYLIKYQNKHVYKVIAIFVVNNQ